VKVHRLKELLSLMGFPVNKTMLASQAVVSEHQQSLNALVQAHIRTIKRLAQQNRHESNYHRAIARLFESILDEYGIPTQTVVNEKLTTGSADVVVKSNNRTHALFEVKTRQAGIGNLDTLPKALLELLLNMAEYLNEKGQIPSYGIITDGIDFYILPFTEYKRIGRKIAKRSEGSDPLIHRVFANDETLPLAPNRGDMYESLKAFLQGNQDIKNLIKSSFVHINIEEKPELFLAFTSPPIFTLTHKYITVNLNKNFYEELLYILGLKEGKKKNSRGNSGGKKKYIVPNEVPNTLYDQTARWLKTRYPTEYTGASADEKLFADALELVIIWLNRILFLKLFEQQLVRFNRGDTQNASAENLRFLAPETVKDTSMLNSLFFHVLAIPPDERPNLPQFAEIPYLNSSLFEEKPLEQKVRISDIVGSYNVPLYRKSILRKTENRARLPEQMPLLEYLLKFLNSYKFVSEEESGSEEMISPAVLGLIFEKINGYKDGSYYTPSELTHFMTYTAITDYFLRKINAFPEIKAPFTDIRKVAGNFANHGILRKHEKEIHHLIKTMTVMDPAVGSAHFLVSAVNILVYLSYLFEVPARDTNGRTIDPFSKVGLKFEIDIDNAGNLHVTMNGEPFAYKRGDENAELLQRWLFHTKRRIIERQVFGVDINPKAVEIARLRLWIELLKHAYYKEDGTMETLPNIDINIRVGNSLTAEFAVAGRMVEADKLAEYSRLVDEYKHTDDKAEKTRIRKELEEKRKELIPMGGQEAEEGETDRLYWDIDFPVALQVEDTGNGKRAVFKGFDIVIGNPPYGISYKKNEVASFLNSLPSAGDSYIWFTELATHLTASEGNVAFLTNFSIMASDRVHRLHQNHLLVKFHRLYFIPFGMRPVPVFPQADISVAVLFAMNKRSEKKPAGEEVASTTPLLYSHEMINLLKREELATQLDTLLTQYWEALESDTGDSGFIDVYDIYTRNGLLSTSDGKNLRGHIPKIGSEVEKRILQKMLGKFLAGTQFSGLTRKMLKAYIGEQVKDQDRIDQLIAQNAYHGIFHRTSGGRYYVVAFTRPIPRSSKRAYLPVIEGIDPRIVGALLSSNIFYWWWIVFSNWHDYPQYLLNSFPVFPLENISEEDKAKLLQLYEEYMDKVFATAPQSRDNRFKIVEHREYLAQFDQILGPYYGLSEDEIAFLSKYKEKVRLRGIREESSSREENSN